MDPYPYNTTQPQPQNQYQYQEPQFPQDLPEPLAQPPSPPLLSKEQQVQMLYSIKMHNPLVDDANENLLDLTCEETNPRTSRNMNYREFMQDRVIEISGPVTIQDGYVISYKLYKIKSRKADSHEYDTVVDRRFSDFQYLHQRLIENYGGFLVPRLPEKNLWASFDMESVEYVRDRRWRLERYLGRVLAHRKLRETEEVVMFLIDPENNFSERKGQHASNATLQDSFQKLTNTALESTSSFLTKYLPTPTLSLSPLSSLSSTLGLSPEPTQHPRTLTKQDQLIMHNEIIINGLTDVLEQLKLIVRNTCEEGYAVGMFGDICGELLMDRDSGKSKGKDKDKERENSRVYDRYSRQIDIDQPKPQARYSKYQTLLQSYQNLFQLIQCCKHAITRRNNLSTALHTLRLHQSTLQHQSRHNPRNITLDITRSKIRQVSEKLERFTGDLLGELDEQVMRGRSMIGEFVGLVVAVRGELYLEGGSGG